jgi:alkanesulfonate monooxygenase SsuD/methylene tetrahydromethanopterin reductase-like flavin-dependent oxidoreductase (luciferase family)
VALRRVARYGDGWFPSFVSAEEFRAGMEKLAAYGAERGRTIDPGEAGALLLTHVTDDRGRAETILGLAAAAFGQTPASLAERSLVGPLAECAEHIRSYVAAGCTKFVLFPLVTPDQLLDQIDLYGRRLIPQVASGKRTPEEEEEFSRRGAGTQREER